MCQPAGHFNRPFKKCFEPHYESETSCVVFGAVFINFECRKSKTKVITLASHNRRLTEQGTNQNSKQIYVIGKKSGKTRATK